MAIPRCNHENKFLLAGIALMHTGFVMDSYRFGVVSYDQHPQSPVVLVKCLKCPICGFSKI